MVCTWTIGDEGLKILDYYNPTGYHVYSNHRWRNLKIPRGGQLILLISQTLKLTTTIIKMYQSNLESVKSGGGPWPPGSSTYGTTCNMYYGIQCRLLN